MTTSLPEPSNSHPWYAHSKVLLCTRPSERGTFLHTVSSASINTCAARWCTAQLLILQLRPALCLVCKLNCFIRHGLLNCGHKHGPLNAQIDICKTTLQMLHEVHAFVKSKHVKDVCFKHSSVQYQLQLLVDKPVRTQIHKSLPLSVAAPQHYVFACMTLQISGVAVQA